MQAARERGLAWRPPYAIDLEDGVWEVHAGNDAVIRIDPASGKISLLDEVIDPLVAFAIAREFALQNGLRWKPSFTLLLSNAEWNIGSCQSQFGGQVHIYVDHRGTVVRHWLNPK